MTGRMQLALNVDDLDESIAFYSKLFGAEPAKVRPGYANFAIADPPLKLILMENPGQGGSLNHLGVEVPDTGAVDAEQTRLAEAGLAAVDERGHHLLLRQAGQVLGRRAPRTASGGRSTPSWTTAPPSGARTAAELGRGRGRARLGPGRSRACRAALRGTGGGRP